jgi:hypothetical protein
MSMPTVLLINGYRFFFFSNEKNEPLHIHIEKAEKYAKFWIDPLFVAINYGFTSKELREISEIIDNNEIHIRDKWFSKDMLFVHLQDGREIGVPLLWFPRLRKASEEELNDWRLIGNGVGIHWESIDEDISISALL